MAKETEKRKKTERQVVDGLFEDYRRSGLALMTTIIGLSSGGFFGLFQIERTREISFLYLIPITIALMQQLTYYLGSRARAKSEFKRLISETRHFESAADYMGPYKDSQIDWKHSAFYFDVSDVFCWLAALALGLATIVPMAQFSSPLVGVVCSVSISLCLAFWALKRYKVYRDIKNTEW